MCKANCFDSRDRPFLPLAEFEHLQRSNWNSSPPRLSAFDISERIAPVWLDLISIAERGSLLFSADFIGWINSELLKAVGLSGDSEFLKPEEWSDFIRECHEAGDPIGLISVKGEGAWLLAQLFWIHLTRFRLLTSWMFISAWRIQEGGSALCVSKEGLGRLLEKLSYAGPPVSDAEELRGSLSDF